jgi:hypothetical protein
VDGETAIDGAGNREGRQGGDEGRVVAELAGWVYCGTEGLFSHCAEGQLMEVRDGENSKGCYEEGKIPICEKGRMERRDEIGFTFPEEKL